jgi:outer membrane protein, heavy metal efflux system
LIGFVWEFGMLNHYFLWRLPLLRLPLLRLPKAAALIYFLLLVSPSQAQSLKDAVEAAWARSPQGQSAAARSEEFRVKNEAASRVFAEPPSIALSQRTDKLNNNRGARETEITWALPLRPWGSRSVDQSLANRELDQQATALIHAKWQLAGRVREAYWATVLADIEHRLAKDKFNHATKFAEDVARRVAAGELAKVDENRAESDKELALITQTEADFKFRQAVRQFTQLTGLVLGKATAETPPQMPFSLTAHPAYAAQVSMIARAKAKTDVANRATRDPYELTLSTIRERADFTEPTKLSARIGIRIPFASSSRNQPRIAEAGAERIEIEAALPLLAQQLDSEYTAADGKLPRAKTLAASAERRAKLARETASLIDKSFQLGETDLPTKLRADAERFDAERIAERAKIEYERAVSHLNQTIGLLP